MKTAIELLERSLHFIDMIKGDEGEIDDGNLENDIMEFLGRNINSKSAPH